MSERSSEWALFGASVLALAASLTLTAWIVCAVKTDALVPALIINISMMVAPAGFFCWLTWPNHKR